MASLVARPPIHTASFENWNPNRQDELFLYLEDDIDREHGFRYKLTVVDRKETVTKKNATFAYSTAVFLVPAGRESEYTFHSVLGLQQIAASASTARLIAVSFGRPPHTFLSQAAVQEELTYVVQILAARQEVNQNVGNAESIPFLALDGIGERNVLATGTTERSGRFLVEQCVADAGQQVRRLYFLDGNPFVIQSEVALSKQSQSNEDAWVVDKSHTAFEYHMSMTAGILARLPGKDAAGLLIGLGGGGLVNLWHHVDTTWTVSAVELDPKVVEIATEHFGLDRQRLNVLIGDGLAVKCASVEGSEASDSNDPLAFSPESLDFIVIDVDTKDTGTGMSCPPAAFVEDSYLQTLLSLLRSETGVLAINVSARDPLLFDSVCQTALSVFPSIFLSKRCPTKDLLHGNDDEEEAEDLNVVVFATRSSDRALPPLREMKEKITRQLQSKDESVLSDLCACLEDVVVNECDSAAPKRNDKKKTTSGNSKRRNNKRGKKKR